MINIVKPCTCFGKRTTPIAFGSQGSRSHAKYCCIQDKDRLVLARTVKLLHKLVIARGITENDTLCIVRLKVKVTCYIYLMLLNLVHVNKIKQNYFGKGLQILLQIGSLYTHTSYGKRTPKCIAFQGQVKGQSHMLNIVNKNNSGMKILRLEDILLLGSFWCNVKAK